MATWLPTLVLVHPRATCALPRPPTRHPTRRTSTTRPPPPCKPPLAPRRSRLRARSRVTTRTRTRPSPHLLRDVVPRCRLCALPTRPSPRLTSSTERCGAATLRVLPRRALLHCPTHHASRDAASHYLPKLLQMPPGPASPRGFLSDAESASPPTLCRTKSRSAEYTTPARSRTPQFAPDTTTTVRVAATATQKYFRALRERRG